MAGDSSAMLGWSWTDLSVLGSQLFGQASAESCGTGLLCIMGVLAGEGSVAVAAAVCDR